MKIVMVGPFGLRIKGTVARRAWPLARALSARGHDVTLLIPPWDSPQDGGLAWTEGGARVVHLAVPDLSSPPSIPPPLPRWGRGGGQGGGERCGEPFPALPLTRYHLRLAISLAAAAWARRPDVVHLFKPKGHTGVTHLLLWSLRRCGVCRARLVVDSDDWEGPGGWNDVAGYSLTERWLFAWQERWGLRHADAVTAASRVLMQRARALRGDSAVFYLPNGVSAEAQSTPSLRPPPERGREGMREDYRDFTPDLSPPPTPPPLPHWGRGGGLGVERGSEENRPSFPYLHWSTPFSECSPAPLPESGRGGGRGVERGSEENRLSFPYLLWFTRFSECLPARGLRLFCRVREQVPQARLLVAGKGLHGEEKELLSRAAAQGLSEAMDYRGWVKAQDLSALFAAATAAMFPMDDTTLQRARCPARLADLLAAGVPVVSERVGEATAYIEDGESGLLVRPGDEAAFVASLVCLLTDEGLRQRLRAGARQRMAKEFSWTKLAEQAETAYRAGR